VNALGPDEFDSGIPVKKFLLYAQIGDQTGIGGIGRNHIGHPQTKSLRRFRRLERGEDGQGRQGQRGEGGKAPVFPFLHYGFVLTSPR